MAERAHPQDLSYINKSKYYYAFIDRYKYGAKYTKDKIVLDVPCGTGWGASLLANTERIYGIDISYDAIQYARSHFKGNFLQCSMSRICFKDGMFDVVLCFEGIEHITKEEGCIFINEAKRVTRDGGLIIGSVPVLDENGSHTGNPYHKFEYPEPYLKSLLNSNFEVMEYIKKQGGDGPIAYFSLINSK